MHGWGRVHCADEPEAVDGVVQIVRPGTGCLSYLVHDGDEAIVVDPSQYVDRYVDAAQERDLEIVGVADTHAHADHVSGAPDLAAEHDVPYYLHGADGAERDDVTAIEDGETLQVGSRDLDVFHTPGHTPGSVSFLFGSALLSGDTLFLRSVGRPDLEDSTQDAVRSAASDLFDSLVRLLALDDESLVLPGHFDDETGRPLATELGELRAETTNELCSYVDDPEWCEKLGRDYHTPTVKTSAEEAIAHRLRRIYLPLSTVVLGAWLLRETAFTGDPFPASAAIGMIPGTSVVTAVVVVYAGAVFVACRPRTWHAKGELRAAELRHQHERDESASSSNSATTRRSTSSRIAATSAGERPSGSSRLQSRLSPPQPTGQTASAEQPIVIV